MPMVWRLSARKILSVPVLVLLVSFTAAYVGVRLWQLQHETGAEASEADIAITSGEPPASPFASANGTHLIAFVVTASDCGWASTPTMMEAVRGIRAKMQSAHGPSYAQVSVVGVALDRNLSAGLRFLSDIGKGSPDGAFDQVIVGGSWLNEQIVRFVWREEVTRATSPQIIVIERSVNTESYLSTKTIEVQSDRLRANPIGNTEIAHWLHEGLPLDDNTLQGATPSDDIAK